MSEGTETVSGGGQRSTDPPPVKVFISYRREDTLDQAQGMCQAFKSRFGEQHVFFDIDQDPGKWKENIERAIKRSDVLVAVIGMRWVEQAPGVRRLEDENDIVRWELRCAFERDIELVPVTVAGADMPKKSELPETLSAVTEYMAFPLIPQLYSQSMENITNKVEQAASQRRARELLSAVQGLAAAAREQIQEQEAERARATLERAKATAEEISDEERYEEALEELRSVERELAKLERRIGDTARGQHDRELLSRVQELLTSARELMQTGESKQARSKVDSAREAAQEISDDRRREGALSEVEEIESAIPRHWRERVRELVTRAQQQLGAGDAALANATLYAAKEAALQIDDDGDREEALSAVAIVEREVRAEQDAAKRGDFSAAEELTGPSGTTRRVTVGATSEPSEPEHAGKAGGKSVWYRWTAPANGTATIDTFGSEFDTLLAVYRGSSLVELELVAANDDVDETKLSRVQFPVTEGVEYMFAVDGYAGEEGAIVVNWEFLEPQSNDDFVAADEITGLTGTVRGDSSAATKELEEPDHAGNAGGSSVWYRWTAPAAGAVTIDTFDSDFDTLLAVYRGSSLSALELVAANDDAEGTTRSQVRFPVAGGIEYMIAVDGYAGTGGAIVLNWEYFPPPSNDGFSAAEQIDGRSGSIRGDSSSATKEPDEPDHAGIGGGKSVWYRWTAPAARGVTIDTLGSEFDTLLAVYRGSRLSELERVAANDDIGGGTRQSRVRFPVAEGVEYMIAVDGYGGASGPLVLNWEARDHHSLTECLDESGLRYEEVGGGAVKIPFAGTSADRVDIDATESVEGVTLFSADLPTFSGFGKRKYLQALLKISYGADYVKALALPNDQFAIGAEIPASSLTPDVCEGLVRSLVLLGDVRAADLRNELGWSTRLDQCKAMQDRHIRVDPEQARRDTYALLDAAGLSSFGLVRFDLDLGPEIRPLTLNVSTRVISLMVTLEGVRPGGDSGKLSRLLDLNREADVAKIGLGTNGDVTLLYEVPQAVPDLAERALVQLRNLYAGVRAAI